MLEEFRARDIERDDWLVLMLDGVRLANQLWAVVALGVAQDGTKHMLDFATVEPLHDLVRAEHERPSC